MSNRILLPRDAEVPANLRFQPYQFRLPREYRGRTVNASALGTDDNGGWRWIEDVSNAGDEDEEDGDHLRALVARMPKSLLRDDCGDLLPDWDKILTAAARRRTVRMAARVYVAERRWRDGVCREDLRAEVIKEAGGSSRRAAARIREIQAAWRWLDLRSTRNSIEAVIRRASRQEDALTARRVLAAPTSTSGADTLRRLAKERIALRLKTMLFSGP